MTFIFLAMAAILDGGCGFQTQLGNWTTKDLYCNEWLNFTQWFPRKRFFNYLI